MKGYETTAAEHNYATMTVEEICALPVADMVADNAALFLRATFPLLPDALHVVEAWGFDYKTAFVWDKGYGPVGHYHNAAAELLIVARRGSFMPEQSTKEDQVQCCPPEGHSRKPAEFREMIDRMYPRGPRVELFARGELPYPWVGWGSEYLDRPGVADVGSVVSACRSK